MDETIAGVEYLDPARALSQMTLVVRIPHNVPPVMKDRSMGTVHRTLETLDPVAFLKHFLDGAIWGRDQGPMEVGERWLLLTRPHVRPQDIALLVHRVSGGLHSMADHALGRLARRVEDVSRYIELPAMVETPQAALFIAPQVKGGPPVRTILWNEPHSPLAVAECHQVLA
jgi:hypothetical protein